jgi:hypothetical protein
MHRLTISCCTLLLVLSLTSACARADSYSGTWSIAPSDKPGQVQLEMRYRHADWRGTQEWDESHDVPAPQVRDNEFTVHTDAGDFDARGTFSGEQGGGTWTFAPSRNFAAELRRRGVNAPSDEQQFALAMSNFKLASLDSLIAAGFERPDAEDLVRMSEHGVASDYIAAMKGLQFTPKSIESLIRLRDHGVTAAFVERMRDHGYTHLSAEDLIRLRDHGF